MGSTQHGIKYPELTDLPNVPSDIGGLQKLNQTAQTWLATLDAANLSTLAATATRAGTEEAYVATTQTAIRAANSRQSAQQTSVNAIQARNDSINTRLNTRDTTLTSDSTAVQGFGGRIGNVNTQAGRGCIGFQSGKFPTTVPVNSTFTPVTSITFNDPAPAASRVYRISGQANFNSTDTNFSSECYIGVAAIAGTTTSGAVLYSATVLAGTQTQYGAGTGYIEGVFTGITASQWTAWLYLTGPSYVAVKVGWDTYSIQSLCLEDIGLQI